MTKKQEERRGKERWKKEERGGGSKEQRKNGGKKHERRKNGTKEGNKGRKEKEKEGMAAASCIAFVRNDHTCRDCCEAAFFFE